MSDQTVLDVERWLRAGDPSVRWQYERDVVGAPPSIWRPLKAAVAEDGFGRSLLDLQDDAGTWGGGCYTPKWTSTTYTLLLLMRFGLDSANAAAVEGCHQLLDRARWVDGGISYWKTHDYPERCVNAMVLAVSSSFAVDDVRLDIMAETLIGASMPGGGWNCEDCRGATHPSFHTTISVLEALDRWRADRRTTAADEAIDRAHEMLLEHRLFRSHRTGAVIDAEWTKPHFPPRWHYDTLRCLDHLRAVGVKDERARDAIEELERRRRPDGTWPKGPRYGGVEFFPLEEDRMRGRWNTMRALRVMRWWHDG